MRAWEGDADSRPLPLTKRKGRLQTMLEVYLGNDTLDPVNSETSSVIHLKTRFWADNPARHLLAAKGVAGITGLARRQPG